MSFVRLLSIKWDKTLQHVTDIYPTGSITGYRKPFCQQAILEKDGNEQAKNLPQSEKLKEACWNGLLKRHSPELFFMVNPEAKMFLWQMRECQNLLAMEMAEEPCRNRLLRFDRSLLFH
jgi:hypothetical protein